MKPFIAIEGLEFVYGGESERAGRHGTACA